MYGMSKGETLLTLIEEGLELRAKIKNADTSGSYRNPLWYDEAKNRLREIDIELNSLLEFNTK